MATRAIDLIAINLIIKGCYFLHIIVQKFLVLLGKAHLTQPKTVKIYSYNLYYKIKNKG